MDDFMSRKTNYYDIGHHSNVLEPTWLTSAFFGLDVEYSPQSPEVDSVGVKGKREEPPRIFSCQNRKGAR